MASTNPANFANLPKDELKEIAAKGGHASHGSSNTKVCIHFNIKNRGLKVLTSIAVRYC